MKVKTISRSADDYVPVGNSETLKMPRNFNPEMHQFERAREYTRALNATKLDRVFAAPFLAQMGGGHVDGVYSLCKTASKLGVMASGSGDGVIKLWNLGQQDESWTTKAHSGIVHGLTFTGSRLLSCSSDCTVKLWDPTLGNHREPVFTYLSEGGLNSIDHHRDEAKFITAGRELELWDVERSKSVEKLSWGADNINSVRFNHTETSLCASTGNDRSVVIYDTRAGSPIQKVVTELSNNAVAWNPMEAFNFAVANENHNAYYYDMRNLKRALNVYKDHVAAVIDLDFSPTGQELVTGSYDRSIRIFPLLSGHSRDVYHTKRMQRVMSVRYSMDSKYIVSGSDDGNVRLWRARANERSGVVSTKQRTKLEYDAALTQKYQHMPEIRKIQKFRNLPQAIKKARTIKNEELDALRRRQQNRVRNSKKGSVQFTSERDRHILGTAVESSRQKKHQEQQRRSKDD